MTIVCQRQYQLEDFEFVGIEFTKFYHVMPEVRTLFCKLLHDADRRRVQEFPKEKVLLISKILHVLPLHI